MSPAGLDDARDVALERQFADLVAAEAELAERATRPTGNAAAVALARRIGVARQLLEQQPGSVTVFVRFRRVVRGRLQLGVLLRILGDELRALQFALDQGSLGHGRSFN